MGPKPFKVGMDMDGVLSDFTKGFMKVHQYLHQYPGPAYGDENCSHYGRIQESSTEEERKNIWNFILSSGTFWRDLPSHIKSDDERYALQQLIKRYQIVVLTCRESKVNSPEYQTMGWIRRELGQWAAMAMPVVALKFKTIKAPVARAIGANVVVDDMPEQIISYAVQNVPVIIRDRPYNRNVEKDCPLHAYVKRAYSLIEVVNAIDFLASA